MFKKIDKYLLENYPLFYHTKLPYIVLVGIVVWLLSLVSGYSLFNQKDTLHYGIDDFYNRSYFVFFHIVIVLIILSLWLLSFYKQNPLKHTYPLQKGYYTKLLLHFTLSLFLLTGAIIPFNYGVHIKFKELINKEQFIQDQNEIEIGEAFLLRELDSYWLKDKNYPNPFPLNGVYKSKTDNTWRSLSNYTNRGDSYNNLYSGNQFYNPKFLDAPYLPENYYELNLFPEILDSLSEVTQIGNTSYIFFKTKSIYSSKDSCDSDYIITEFVKINDLSNLAEVSLYNYNFPYNRTDRSEELQTLLNTKDKSKILEQIKLTLDLFSKYSIDYKINEGLLTDYLMEKDFQDFDFIFIQNDFNSYNYKQLELPLRNLTALESSLVAEKMYYDSGDYSNLRSNFKQVDLNEAPFLVFWIIIQLAFYLGLLFVWFEFTNLKSFLLTIPVLGVLAVIFAFNMNFVDVPNDATVFKLLLIYLSVLFCAGLFSIYNNKVSKLISSIGLNILLLLSITYIFIILCTIQENITYTKITKCNESIEKLYPDLANPFFFWPLSLISILFYFLLIKVWKSKKN